MNINNILNGWKNFMDKSEVSEKLAVDRAVHCLDCEFKEKGVLMYFKDTIKEMEGYKCTKCPSLIKCPLSAKIRSNNEKCPIGKW